MGFTEAVRTCFRKYFTFSGRAPRSEFWYFVLFLFLGQLVAVVVNSMLFGPEIRVNPNTGQVVGRSYNDGRIGDVFFLATVVPHIAVGWRRMHDSGRAGYLPYLPWLVLIAFILWSIVSAVGWATFSETLRATGAIRVESDGGFAFAFVLLLASILLGIYWLTRPSEPGPNKYGPNPFDPANTADLPEVFK
ncbi:MAG: DUF805 domain-containing protein [Pseudomonadota bacterium]